MPIWKSIAVLSLNQKKTPEKPRRINFLAENLEGVVKAYSQQDYQRTLVILLEDFGGESLEQWMHKRPDFCPIPQPVPPHELNATIPRALSDMILKLMAKNAEDRYQSAWGIKADLEICTQQLEEIGQIDSIQLGLQDISDQFQIPQKLYGRDKEVAMLLAAFDSESVAVATLGASALLRSAYSPSGILRQASPKRRADRVACPEDNRVAAKIGAATAG